MKNSPNTPTALAYTLLNKYERKPSAENPWQKADEALSTLLNQQDTPTLQKGSITQLVYGTLRYWLELGSWVEHFTQKRLKDTPANTRCLLRLGLYQLRYLTHSKPYAVVNETIELAKQHRFPAGQLKLLNAVLRAYVRLQETTSTDHASLPLLPCKPHWSPLEQLAKRHSMPTWLVTTLSQVFEPEALVTLLEACKQPAPLAIRVNTLQTTLANYQQQLAEHRITYTQPWETVLPTCLLITSKVGSPTNLPGFETGSFYVQDLGSAYIAAQAPVQPQQTVIDLCAAPGSKTFLLAEQLQGQGSLTAVDISANRLERLKENAQRLGITAPFLTVVTASALTFKPQQLADVIMVDAPCSGLGTIKRHPERLLSITPEQLAEYPPLQLGILQHATTCLKPQGSIVYSTCSIHPQENNAVIEAFLTSPQGEGFCVKSQTLLPITPLHDGFFVAVLERH